MPALKYPLIGVTGRAGAGKDTVCRMACDHLRAYRAPQQGSSWIRKYGVVMAMATPLKDACLEIYGRAYGVKREAFYGSQEEKLAPLEGLPGWNGRKLAQHIGTEGFRHPAPEVWGRYLLETVALEFKGWQPASAVFVSDVRFPDEAKLIQEAGGVIVKVIRPSIEAKAAEGDVGLAGHASEAHFDAIQEDYVINNMDGPLESLDGLVLKMLEHYELLPVSL